MTTPETLKSAPSSTANNTHSDKILKGFRATLKQRWEEFHQATLQEAGGIQLLRDAHEDFRKAKATFDEAMGALEAIDTDAKLKQILENPGRLAATINELKNYLAGADKQKGYNTVLTHTLADLTGLKAQMTERPEDKKEAETAVSTLKTMPAVALASGAGALLSGGEVRSVLDGAKGEITTEVKKALGPWGMIFRGVKDVPPKEVATQVKDLAKEYSEKKWMDDPMDKLFALVKLFFLKWQIGRADMDLSGEMTPEEMKLAGIKTRLAQATGNPEAIVNTPDKKYTASRYIFQGLFLNSAHLPITDILDNIQMKGSKIGDLKSVYEKKSYDAFLAKIGRPADKKNREGLEEIIKVLFEGRKSKYILEAYNSSKKLPKNSPHASEVNFGEYIISASIVLKNMGTIAKTALTQKIADPRIKLQNDGKISYEDPGEEEEVASSLFGGDKKIMGFMLGTNKDSKYKIGESEKTLANMEKNSAALQALYPETAEKEKALSVMRKIFTYADGFMAEIIKNPNIHLGMGTEIATIIKERSLSFRGLSMIYTLMQAKDISNFSELSTVEQAQVYSIVGLIFQTEENSVSKGRLTSRYTTALWNSSDTSIPGGVKGFLSDTTSYVSEKAAKGLLESGKYFAGIAEENPKLALSLLALNLPFIPDRSSVAGLLF